MTINKDEVAPQAPIAGKEPWETPRVVAAAIKEATAYYTANDDFSLPS